MMLIKELKNLIKGAAPDLRPNSSNDSKLNCTSVPMVICGDMNSVPESGRSVADDVCVRIRTFDDSDIH